MIRDIFTRVANGQGFKKIAHALNAAHALAPLPSSHVIKTAAEHGIDRTPRHAPSTLRAIVFREMYRGRPVWNRTKKRDAFGETAIKGIPKPATEWIAEYFEHLQIVPDELWDAAHARLARARERYLRTHDGRLEGRPPSSTEARYLLTGLAVCGLYGGGLQVRRKLGGKLLLYGCHTSRTCGTSVCANRLQADVRDTDQAILGMLDAVVLDPPTSARIIRDAITRLDTQTTTSATERAKLEKASREFETQITRLTTAIADGGGTIPSLVAKLKAVEAERLSVIEQLRKLDGIARVQSIDLAKLEAVIAAKVANWRGLLKRHPVQARQILSKLLVSRLVFTPLGTHYQVSGAASATVLLSALIPAQPIGPPSGSSDDRSNGAWPQRDSNPCLSRDHVFAKSLMQLRINNVPKVRHD